MRRGDMGANALERGAAAGARLGRERPQRAEQIDRVGQDIMGRARGTLVIDSTIGSVTGVRRATSDCSAMMISAATGTGSSASCGIAA